MTAEDEALIGGMAYAGAGFRRGEWVDRPAPRHARELHACLRALAERGGWERRDRVQTWLADHRRTFTAALLS